MAKPPNHIVGRKRTFNESLKYIGPNTVILDLPFILTTGKIIHLGFPLLYTEGSRSFAVRILDAWDEDEIVYLKIQDIKNDRCFNISWNLNYTGEYWLWSLSTLDYLASQFSEMSTIRDNSTK